MSQFCRFLAPIAFGLCLLGTAHAGLINDTTQNVSYRYTALYNWFAGGTTSLGDVVEGGPEFDTQKLGVATTPYTLQLGFYTQFDGDDLGAHYADIFLATDPAHPDLYNFAIALGAQAPYGGVTAGLYAVSGNYQTSIDRWKTTGYIYGGQYISPNDGLPHDAPTVVTGGTQLSGWTVGVSQTASGDPTYPYLLSVTLTALNQSVLDSVFSGPAFSLLWGTGDCNNDSVYIGNLTPPPDEVPEPGALPLFLSALLICGLVTAKRRIEPSR